MVTYTPTSEDVRLYEIAVLHPYPINQKEQAELQKGVDAIFADAGAKEIFRDAWGRRGLAYKIGGFMEAHFTIYYLELDPRVLKDIDQQLRILKGVLRHMIVKPPEGLEIRSYADAEKQWKERERLEEAQRAAEKEERLKKQVLDKAKRKQAPAARKEAPKDKPAVTREALSAELDKLISDKDLDI
jgi:ribosomal protein S6